ncbi:hypothetical protein PMIN04_013259 [Paraphaeosphaeria minitans]
MQHESARQPQSCRSSSSMTQSRQSASPSQRQRHDRHNCLHLHRGRYCLPVARATTLPYPTGTAPVGKLPIHSRSSLDKGEHDHADWEGIGAHGPASLVPSRRFRKFEQNCIGFSLSARKTHVGEHETNAKYSLA